MTSSSAVVSGKMKSVGRRTYKDGGQLKSHKAFEEGMRTVPYKGCVGGVSGSTRECDET